MSSDWQLGAQNMNDWIIAHNWNWNRTNKSVHQRKLKGKTLI